MGMTINTNLSALTAYRNLSTTQNEMSSSLAKLSSGLRINSAKDDAAGLAISEGLKSQVGGLTVAARNAQDGINVAQTAEGSLGQVQAILQRMRDLAVQAGNDSNNVDSRKAITAEADQLTSELGRIATSTNFNGISLLSGDVDSGQTGAQTVLSFQVGANGTSDNQIQVDLKSANVTAIASTLGSANKGSNFTVTAASVTGVQSFSVTNSDGSVTAVKTAALPAAGAYTTTQDVADALNKDSQFAANLVATVNAAGDLNVKSLTGGAVGTTTAPGTGVATGATAPTAGGLDFSSAAGAQASIKILDTAITGVSSARASLGAVQNRLEYTITNLNISKENLTASQSQITDTDMASEMVNFTRSSILAQAGTAMLAQANQANSGVLKLLQ
ncbi:flagellin N-terminal helical domain-containing protein [Parafrigoribacterium humi]|uniref:flagellin N-terminal helical domain-containing protein n=1 Tax=Parafrigoribacterium humi TaxID=3144664 RepID=UPI0032EDD589